MHRAHHVYRRDMSRPRVQTGQREQMLRVSLLQHEESGSEQQTQPRLPECFFSAVTALNKKNAGQPRFPPPFVSPLP